MTHRAKVRTESQTPASAKSSRAADSAAGRPSGRVVEGGPVAALPVAEGPEGERSEAAGPVAEGRAAAASPLEVTVRRRHFSVAFKARMVKEASELVGTPGAVSALLRREGLYSSHLSEWRKGAAKGHHEPGHAPKPGRPSKDGLAPGDRQLVQENTRLRERLRKAEIIIEFQKKMAALLEQLSPSLNE